MEALYFSHLMEDAEAIRLLEQNPCIGLESIEFGIGFTLDDVDQTEKNYRNRVGEWTEKRPFSVHGPFLDLNPGSYDSLIAEASLKRFRQSYDLAKRFEADRIVFHSGFNPQTAFEQGWAQQSAEFWKRFLEPLDGSIKVHIENVLDLHVEIVEEILTLTDCPFFTACVDIGHANAYAKQTPEYFIERLGNRIGHLHLHDNHGERDEHLPLGEGDINIERILGLVAEKCPNASITLEHSYSDMVTKSIAVLNQHGFRL